MGEDRAIARQLLSALVALGLIATVSAACSSDGGTVRGIVVSVDGDLADVTSFEVRADGETLRFHPAPDGDFDFLLTHLRDHLRTGEPVIVGYEDRGSGLVATSLSDG